MQSAGIDPRENHDGDDGQYLRLRDRPPGDAEYCSGEGGDRTPENLANATPTAAMVPVWITAKRVQP